MSNLQIALTMTVIGMGIVFIGILVLWGLMALMVRIWPHDANEWRRSKTEVPAEAEPARRADLKAQSCCQRQLRLPCACRQGLFSQYPPASTALPAGSAWQVTTRALPDQPEHPII